VWSAEKRAEGLEYMHPEPSSHSGSIVGKRKLSGNVSFGSIQPPEWIASELSVTREESAAGAVAGI
jgi:hypothetical protein